MIKKKLPIIFLYFFFVGILFLFFASYQFSNPILRIVHRYNRLNSFKNETNLHGSVLFLGDSQIELLKPFVYCNSNQRIVNHGISGEKSHGLLKRLSSELTIKPSAIFIVTGINDLLAGYCKNEIVTNYEQIIRKIKTNNPSTNITLISIYPLGYERPKLNDTIKVLNCDLKNLSNHLNSQFIDVYSLLINKNGFLDNRFSNDGLHLNNHGQNFIISVINSHCFEKTI